MFRGRESFVHRVGEPRGLGLKEQLMNWIVEAKPMRRLLPAAQALIVLAAAHSHAAADPLILQGSTTFNRRVMEPHEAAIEARSKQDITVIPNRTMLGLIALMEG